MVVAQRIWGISLAIALPSAPEVDERSSPIDPST
jgi:hypothetical protein